jgi:hypothetical protein
MLSNLLLDIATDKYDHSKLEEVFDKIAIELLRNTKLVTPQNQYTIKEIEFYLSSDHYRHLDPYTHRSQRQLLCGQWYFHRFKSVETYSRQKFKGLDITFGAKRHNNYGGILIRKIQNIATNAVIDGIGKIVSALMDDLSPDKFTQIATDDLPMKVFNSDAPLRLEVFENSLDMPILKTTRKNLGFVESEDEIKFFNKQYNYFNDMNVTLVAE